MVELFPTPVRYTSLSVPYHTAGVISGATPLIAVSLTAKTGNLYAGLWFPLIMVTFSVLFIVFFSPETYLVDIEELGNSVKPVDQLFTSDFTETTETIIDE